MPFILAFKKKKKLLDATAQGDARNSLDMERNLPLPFIPPTLESHSDANTLLTETLLFTGESRNLHP